MRKIVIILSVFVLIANSCGQATKKQMENENDSAKVDNVTNTLDNDTITYDHFYFPIDSTFTIKVLTAGTFHSDEVWENADKEKWFGLFQGETGFYIAETELTTKRVYDAVADDNEDEATGWEVQTINKDTSMILFEKINYLTAHNVQQAILSKEEIYPGDTLQINYLGVDYKIFATGGKKKTQDVPEWFDVWNYKLYLTATIEGKERKSLLVAQPNFDDQMINLIFAGDIDGDGILDLIIDTSRHYNVTSPTIYLSRPAEEGEVVKPIGGHISVGC